MRDAVVHCSASLVQDVNVPPGVLGRVGYRDNSGVGAVPSRDGQHTHTVPPASLRTPGAGATR